MKKTFVVFISLQILLAACSGRGMIDPDVSTEAPSEKAASPDEALVEEPDPTVTGTSEPSLTPSPTERISSTTSPTPRPSRTSTAVQEADVRVTVAAQSEPVSLFSLDSPDGKWRTEGVRYECTLIEEGEYAGEVAYEEIVLTGVNAGTESMIDSQLQSCGGLGAFGLGGLFWSPNSQYFYYTDAREGLPDGGCGFWGRPILRYDIQQAETTRLGIGPLSPDGSKLATWQGRDLVVWDLDGAETGRAPAAVEEAEAYLGQVVWAPDGQALVTLQVENYCPLSGKSYLVLFDLVTMEPEILLVSETPTFGDVSWDGQEELRLVDEKGDSWRFDLGTKHLAPSP